MDAFGAFFLEMGHEFRNRLCFVELGVVVALHHLHESPLGPLVELRVAGAHLTVPVIAETYAVELLTVAGYVIGSGFLRVLSGLDGILLCGETVGIVAHRMEHIEALQALVARVDVRGDVA